MTLLLHVRRSTYACGSFNGSIYLYEEISGEAVAALPTTAPSLTSSSTSTSPTTPGVSHLRWAPDGHLLFGGIRNSDLVLAWDVRAPDRLLYSLPRAGRTHQRLYIDVDPSGSVVAAGTTQGQLCFYSTKTGELELEMDGFPDTVNCVAFHPAGRVLASTTGQRHLGLERLEDSDDECDLTASNVTQSAVLSMWRR